MIMTLLNYTDRLPTRISASVSNHPCFLTITMLCIGYKIKTLFLHTCIYYIYFYDAVASVILKLTVQLTLISVDDNESTIKFGAVEKNKVSNACHLNVSLMAKHALFIKE